MRLKSQQLRIYYKPDGTLWSNNFNRFVGNVPVTGTYTVRISTPSFTFTGPYSLQYVAGAEAVANGTLTSGTSFNGTLASKNSIQSFQFSGTSGRYVALFTGASYLTTIHVFKPDGSVLASGNGRVWELLPATGTYNVVVSGADWTYTGNYRLDYFHGGEGVSDGELKSGTSYYGNMLGNGLESFTFEGVAGKTAGVFVGASFGATSTVVDIFKPDGTLLDWAYERLFSTNLPATGTYTVLVTGYSGTYGGDYRLDYWHGGKDVSNGTLINGIARPGTLLKTGLDSYKFASTGSVAYTLASTAAYGRYVLWTRPDGTYLGAFSSGYSGTLPAYSGDYNVVFYGGSSSNTGDYTITATTTAPSVPATNADECPTGTCPMPPTVRNIAGSAFGLLFPDGINGASTDFGGGINFDMGVKTEMATDYNAGNLSFIRTYRSDSTWSDNTVGTYWRHNYSRVLNITGSAAYVVDGSGAKRTFTLSGSNWIPDDPSTRTTLVASGSDYLYTLPDGTVEKYNSSKLLTRIAYRTQGAVNLGYNGSSQLTSVTNENGRALTLTYSSGKVATVVTPDGTFSYSYTSNNLTTVTKPDTKTTVYHYENGSYVNALTGITDEKGVRFATFAYNGSGKAISTEHAGAVDEWDVTAFNANNSTTTNPLGKTTTFYYTNIQGVRRVVQVAGAASTNCVASNKYYNYDTLGRMIGKTDWENNVTNYQYDSRSNVTRIVEAANTTTPRITNISYIGAFNLPDVISEPGKTTDFDYDVYGRVTSMTVTDTATSVTRITTYTYFSNGTDGSGNVILGRLQQVDGPRTDVADDWEYTYDANYDLETVTNPLGQVTEITARDAAGRPTTVEDANDIETVLTYDTNGWLATATRAYGTGLAALYDFDYDFNGNLVKVTLPNSVFVEYSYDNAQRLTGIEDSLGNTVAYTLDDWGNATQVDVSNTTPTVTYTHDQTFDELARMISSIGAATPAQTATFAYDKNSNLTTYTDPKTNATGYTYDALQRLKTSTNALSGVTTLAYTGLDDVSSVTDQRSHSTTYTYNAFGDVTGEVSPDRGTLSYTVDKAGNVTQRTDGNSVVTNFTYDALNRVLTVAYPADSSLNATLTYDSSSGCGTAYKGRLCTVADATGTTTYVYDVLGRVTSASENRGGGLSLATSYTYDLAGNIATITLPSGRVVTYTRNANGYVSTVAAPVNGSSVNLASSVTYLPFGPLNALTYGNSLTLSATFDTDYNPTNRTISGGIANWTYTTDKNSNVTQAGSTTYGYDALNRVNAENAGAATTYTYDATSNRLTKVQGSTTTTTVPSTNNKISAVGGTSYTYDSAGNITAIGTNGYVWSKAGLMKEYTISGTTTGTYTYNAYNQRTKKLVSGTTTHYVYGANGLLYGEYTTAGALVREYIYLNDQPLAQVTAGSPETVAYLHVDHLGTPRFATNSGGSSVWSWNNDAFGVSSPSGATTVNLRMPGQYYDSESGLFYNWNRYYNPAIGRYISSDPIGLAGGLNTFGYAGQNPVMFMDPYGLYGWWDFQGDVADATIAGLEGWAGFSDTVTWGLSKYARQALGTDYADYCSTAYDVGKWSGIAASTLAGGIVGLRAAGTEEMVKKGVIEFSHWIPKRMGGPRSVWNGNYVTTPRHYYNDPYRYPSGWRALGDKFPAWLQQLDRIPNVYIGAGAGGAFGAGGAYAGSCGCNQ